MDDERGGPCTRVVQVTAAPFELQRHFVCNAAQKTKWRMNQKLGDAQTSLMSADFTLSENEFRSNRKKYNHPLVALTLVMNIIRVLRD